MSSILDQYINNKTENDKFIKLTNVEKIEAIEKVLDDEIRHMLLMDGGNCELVDLKEEGDKVIVSIKYLGACSSCGSSNTDTLMVIEEALQDSLHTSIRVMPI